MDLGLKDKRAVVLGASKGLGLAVAVALAGEGARPVLCARQMDSLAEAAKVVRERTGIATGLIPADLSEPGAVDQLIGEALAQLGGIDILVTNAGGPPAGGLLDFGSSDWEAAFRLNCLSALEAIQAVAPLMKSEGWGRIINLTSVSVKEPIPNLILSNGVRAGLIGAAKTASQELAPFGITINNIATGWTKTDRVKELLTAKSSAEGRPEDEIEAGILASIPLGRMNTPQEVADLVAFLASDRAAAITGTTIAVDGGYCRSIP